MSQLKIKNYFKHRQGKSNKQANKNYKVLQRFESNMKKKVDKCYLWILTSPSFPKQRMMLDLLTRHVQIYVRYLLNVKML